MATDATGAAPAAAAATIGSGIDAVAAPAQPAHAQLGIQRWNQGQRITVQGFSTVQPARHPHTANVPASSTPLTAIIDPNQFSNRRGRHVLLPSSELPPAAGPRSRCCRRRAMR